MGAEMFVLLPQGAQFEFRDGGAAKGRGLAVALGPVAQTFEIDVQLRTARKPGEDLKGLRTEVLDLQKSNRELKKDLEMLKKRIEAK